MTRIQLGAAPAEQVLATVRETFECREYFWEETGPPSVVAGEGGKPVSTLALGVSQRLRVAVRVDAEAQRLVLRQQTLGVAYMANDGPVRYRRMVKAVRADLAAAALC